MRATRGSPASLPRLNRRPPAAVGPRADGGALRHGSAGGPGATLSPGVSAGIGLLSLAGLLFQVALTRLASAALNYHLTFLAVGAGVLGTGIGATWVACWAPARTAPSGGADGGGQDRRLAWLAVGAGAGIALAGAAFAWVPLGRIGAPGLLGLILLAYPLLAAPYVCIGGAVALAVRAAPRRAGRLYGADLIGAGAGCLLAVPLMNAVGPPLAAAGAALAALAAAPLLAPPGRGIRLGAMAAGVLAVAGVAVPAGGPNVLPTKPLAVLLDPARHPGAALLHTHWDATSRVDVFRSPGAALLWSAGEADALGLTIDADALTAVPGRRPGSAPPYVGRLTASVAFAVAPRGDVLVIGPGGGVDVAAALAYGARGVDAVEVNPGVARLVRGPLAPYTGNLFGEPGVRLVVDEGRGFLRRTPERYGAIVLTAVDSWAALAAGSYSLAESYLYTEEALRLYLDRLEDGGVLAVSRWFTAPPREMQRLTVMATEALRARGADPAASLLLVRAADFGTLLVRRGPFTPGEIARAQAFAEAEGFGLALGSQLEGTPADGVAVSVGVASVGAAASGAEAGVVGRPATDDRPFFFDFLPWSSALGGTVPAGGLPRGHAVLLVALLQGACLGVAGVVLPRRRLPAWCSGGRRLRLGLYGAVAGLGFMLAELSLLQRLTLLLGQPALSLAAALAGLLLGAGVGAVAWRRASPLPMLGAALVLGGEALLLPALWDTALGWPFWARLLLAGGAGFVPALLMGAALPAGAARLGRSDPAALPWLWATNGAASAVGAALAVMLAMEWGGRAVLLLSAGLYLVLAALLATGAARGGAPSPRQPAARPSGMG